MFIKSTETLKNIIESVLKVKLNYADPLLDSIQELTTKLLSYSNNIYTISPYFFERSNKEYVARLSQNLENFFQDSIEKKSTLYIIKDFKLFTNKLKSLISNGYNINEITLTSPSDHIYIKYNRSILITKQTNKEYSIEIQESINKKLVTFQSKDFTLSYLFLNSELSSILFYFKSKIPSIDFLSFEAETINSYIERIKNIFHNHLILSYPLHFFIDPGLLTLVDNSRESLFEFLYQNKEDLIYSFFIVSLSNNRNVIEFYIPDSDKSFTVFLHRYRDYLVNFSKEGDYFMLKVYK